MAISTNSIIHYTKNLENLHQILESGFYMKYCKEEFFGKNNKLRYAYPMVCFCDIPLSEVKNHLDSYGHFGIGLKKEWAIKNGLNPVLYLEKESLLTETLMQQIARLDAMVKESKTNPKAKKIDQVWRHELITMSSFVKNYEGDLIIDSVSKPNYRFYNEREWRYVPTVKELKKNPRAIRVDEYLKNKIDYNNAVKEVKLSFDLAHDISYIIVKEDQDIHKTLEFISHKFKKKLSLSDMEILMTKILSTDQIINDF